MDPAAAFGIALRAARKQAEITQEQLALRAGVERNFISLIERGINQPTIRVVFKLANALGVPASTLIMQAEQEMKKSSSS